jgi:hypothetical protein
VIPDAQLKSLGVCIAVAISSPLLMGVQDRTSNFDNRILAAQNRERAEIGVAPLVWSGELKSSAQSWANHLAATGALENAYDDSADPQGENLWEGTRGYYTPEAMVDRWVEEKRFFKQGAFPDNSITHKMSDVGLYTQVVWRNTGSVGCAKATGQRHDVLVCRYKNAGNYEGQRPF